MHFQLTQQKHCWHGILREAGELNRQLLAAFAATPEHQRRQSHYFHNRFENIYIEHQQLDELSPVLAALEQAALSILKTSTQKLKIGYWFNLMEPGQLTSLHSHDDFDEMLSAVYYIKVPGNSGTLRLHARTQTTLIRPKAGEAIFFSPSLPHDVSINNSTQSRLSLGINFGPA